MPLFTFGSDDRDAPTWKIEAPSLARAIRMFRVGAEFPHAYSSAPIKTGQRVHLPGTDVRVDVALSSAPGAYVLVRERRKNEPRPADLPFNRYWPDNVDVEVARIPPETADDEAFTPALLAATVPTAATTAIAAAKPAQESTALTFENATRRDLEEKHLDLERTKAELERLQREASAALQLIRAELKQRMEQVWMIELFLGSKEEVRQIASGAPAPADTKITVRQRVLCMDEEMAVFQWFEDPKSIGKIDGLSVEGFDAWVTSDPRRLDAICPWQKGFVGLRVRRKAKHRESANIGEALYNAQLAERDTYTYLLVRNGENLYRLWIDVDLWPRLFPSEADTEISGDGLRAHMGERDREARMKHQVAGLMALTGLLQRSDLFAPLPHPQISAFNPLHVDEYFLLVRDDEDRVLLGDGRDLEHLSWGDVFGEREVDDKLTGGTRWESVRVRTGYRSWLREQIDVGVRVLYTGRTYDGSDDYEKLYRRTGIQRLSAWPRRGKPFTICDKSTPEQPWWTGQFAFMYLPNESVYRANSEWGRGGYVESERKRRVRFVCYGDELVPIDFLSYRVLEHLIRDRGQRASYEDFFSTAFEWWSIAKQEADRERPFVDLVLTQAGVPLDDEHERARVERLLRWWKLKTKEHRTLATDDAKALRMILAAFKRGDDHENDPEVALMRALRLGRSAA